jgi:hypothetical protein
MSSRPDGRELTRASLPCPEGRLARAHQPIKAACGARKTSHELRRALLVGLGLTLVGDVGVGEGESVLRGGDNAHEAAADVLLEVLLGQVLDVALREGDRRRDGELGRLALERDGLAELAGLAVDLDAVVEVLLVLGGCQGESGSSSTSAGCP